MDWPGLVTPLWFLISDYDFGKMSVGYLIGFFGMTVPVASQRGTGKTFLVFKTKKVNYGCRQLA